MNVHRKKFWLRMPWACLALLAACEGGGGGAAGAGGSSDSSATSSSSSSAGPGPTVSVSAPSRTSMTNIHSLTFTATYADAAAITLSSGGVTLNTTGTANCTASVSGSGTTTRTISLASCTGDGTVGVTINAATATNSSGTPSTASAASSTVTLYGDVGTFVYYSGRSPLTAIGSANVNKVAQGDFNADGYPDLVMARRGGGGAVYLNNGYGRFKNPITFGGTATTTVGLATATQDVLVGDFNGDSKSDVVLINSAGDVPRLWLNNGSGTAFTSSNGLKMCATSTSTVADARRGAAADLDGDGNLDVAFVIYGGKNCFNKGSGSGTFTSFSAGASADPNDYVLDSRTDDSTDIDVGDIDADGDKDLVVANVNPTQPDRIYKNNGSGSFTASNLQLNGSDEALCDQSIGLGSLNAEQDSRLDLVFGSVTGACGASTSQARYSLQNSDGTFASSSLITGSSTSSQTWDLLLEDLNGDNSLDVFLINNTTADLVRKWDTSTHDFTQFSAADTYGPGSANAGAGGVIADFNKDGFKDVVMARYSSQTYDHSMIYYGTRSGYIEKNSWFSLLSDGSTENTSYRHYVKYVGPSTSSQSGRTGPSSVGTAASNATISNFSGIAYDPVRDLYYAIRNNDLKINEFASTFGVSTTRASRDLTLTNVTAGTGQSGDLEDIVYLGQSGGVSEFAVVNENGDMYIGTIPASGGSTTLDMSTWKRISIDTANKGSRTVLNGSAVVAGGNPGGSNYGIESLTYDRSHQIFYAAREGESSFDKVIYAFPRSAVDALSSGGDLSTSTEVSTFVFNLGYKSTSDISGIGYNPDNDTLILVSDQDNRAYEITQAGILLGVQDLPFTTDSSSWANSLMQHEGICVGKDNLLVVVSEQNTSGTDNVGNVTSFSYQP